MEELAEVGVTALEHLRGHKYANEAHEDPHDLVDKLR